MDTHAVSLFSRQFFREGMFPAVDPLSLLREGGKIFDQNEILLYLLSINFPIAFFDKKFYVLDHTTNEHQYKFDKGSQESL